MVRPLRIEYPGALYHVTSRGDRQGAIFDDDQDRTAFLNVLSEVVSRFRWRCHAYRLMGNHFHLLLEVGRVPLSKAMQVSALSLYPPLQSALSKSAQVGCGSANCHPIMIFFDCHFVKVLQDCNANRIFPAGMQDIGNSHQFIYESLTLSTGGIDPSCVRDHTLPCRLAI